MSDAPLSSSVILVEKAIAVVDMVGYGTVARLLEENGGPGMVAQLNRQIEQLIDVGVASLEYPASCRMVARTGDGAVLMFDRCEDACLFAETVHEAAQDRNRLRQEISARRVFRIGIACGDVTWEQKEDSQQGFAGMTIANAVRLEGAAVGGQTVVDHCVYDHLPNEMKVRFGAEEVVRGKRDEVFRARRAQVRHDVFVGPEPRSLKVTRRSTLLGVGASVVAAAGGWYGWSRGTEMLYPLPQKRFVAVVNWPVDKNDSIRGLMTGLAVRLTESLTSAEAYDHDFLAIPHELVPELDAATQFSRLSDLLGTNLILAVSGRPVKQELEIRLSLFIPSKPKALRDCILRFSSAERFDPTPKITRSAAEFLHVRYDEDRNPVRPMSKSASALSAFSQAEAFRSEENDSELASAIQKYGEALDDDPRFAEAHARLGAAYLRLFSMKGDRGGLALAKDNALMALSIRPDLVEAHVVLSSVLDLEGDYEGAVKELASALRGQPMNWHTLVIQGQFFTKWNEWADAELAFQRVLASRPNYWLARNELGAMYHDQGKYAKALEQFLAARLAAPRNALAHSNVGAMYTLFGRFEEAEGLISKSLRLSPTDNANNAMAFLLRSQGEPGRAVSFAAEATTLGPGDVTNWIELGDCYEAEGSHAADARKAFLQGAAVSGENTRVNRRDGPSLVCLALCLAKTGEFELAIQTLERSKICPIGDIDTQLYYARTSFLLHRKEEANAIKNRCLQEGATEYQMRGIPDLASV